MKQLRQLCAATVLSVTFALSAFAGDIQFPGITSPPQSTNTTSPSQSTNSTSISTATEILLAIMQAIRLP